MGHSTIECVNSWNLKFHSPHIWIVSCICHHSLSVAFAPQLKGKISMSYYEFSLSLSHTHTHTHIYTPLLNFGNSLKNHLLYHISVRWSSSCSFSGTAASFASFALPASSSCRCCCCVSPPPPSSAITAGFSLSSDSVAPFSTFVVASSGTNFTLSASPVSWLSSTATPGSSMVSSPLPVAIGYKEGSAKYTVVISFYNNYLPLYFIIKARQ